jgi:hypothetical protein
MARATTTAVTALLVMIDSTELSPLLIGIAKHDKPCSVGLNQPHEFVHVDATREAVKARNDDRPDAALAVVYQPL